MENPVGAWQLLHDLWADFADPDFIWQVLALVVSLIGAALIAHGWRQRGVRYPGRLQAASGRLAFPLSGMLLVGVSLLLLKPFVHVNLLRLALPLLGSLALVRGVVWVLRQAFPQAAGVTAWARIIATVVWGWLALTITDLAPFVIAALEQVQFKIGQQSLNLWMLLHGLVTLFLTVVAALWLAAAIEKRLMGLETLDDNLRIVGVRVTKAVLTVLAILIGLSLVGIDMTALSVFTGALGVGLGLGLQKIASNYVSGFIILLDRSIRIGNIVQVGNDVGEVTQITTRYTVLRNVGGTEHIVPNDTLMSTTVQNQTFSNSEVRLTASVGVAYDTDVEQAMRLLENAALAQARVLADPPPKALLVRFGESSIDLEVGFWIDDPNAGKLNILSEVNLAIWRAFKAHGIVIPFPQREVRVVGQNESPATTP